MRKSLLSILFTLLIVFLSINSLKSQSGSWNYTVTGGPSSPINMTGSSVIGSGGDDVSYNLNWPFAGIVYDDLYTVTDNIYMNSNGIMRFDASLYVGAGNGTIPSFPTNYATIKQCISYGGNSDGHISGNVVKKVTGVTGSRILTIAFTYYTNYSGTSSHHADIQISYFESSHNIKIDYANVGGTTTPASQLGINAGDGVWGADFLASFPTQDTSFTLAPGATFDPPTTFTATAVSSTSNQLSWIKNANQSNVIIAYNTTNQFANPVMGAAYSVGSQILSGMGTILYVGGSTSYTHTGLTPNTTYYYKIWSKLNNYNYYSGSGLIDSAMTSIPVPPNASITANGVTTICQGDTVILTSNSSPAYHYQWYKNSQLITGENQYVLNVLTSGNYSIMITDTTTNLDSLSSSITVVVNSSSFNTNFSCNNPVLISPNTTALITNTTPNPNAYYFNWGLGDGSNISGQSLPNNTHTYSSNGYYNVSLTATDTLTGCSETNTKNSFIYVSGISEPCNPFIAAINQPGYVSYICPGDSFYLSTNFGINFSYQWMRNSSILIGDTLNYIYANIPGTYRVIVDYLPDTCIAKVSLPHALSLFSTTQPIIQHDSNYIPCTNDSLRFFVSNSSYFNNYHWSNGFTSQNSNYSNSSNVFVEAIDNNGCSSYSDTTFFNADSIASIPICIVTIDSTFTHNVIRWMFPYQQNLDSMYIFKEYNKNDYIKIGAVSALITSEFHDLLSNPTTQSYKYKIQVKDSCGNISTLSPFHESIHLQISNAPNGYNLSWNYYKGALISTYYIYRSTDSIHYSLIDSTSGNSFTDNTPNAYYALEAILANPCSSSSKANVNYNVSRSNRKSNITLALTDHTNILLDCSLIPNPNKGRFTIRINNCNDNNVSMIIYNSLGEIITSRSKLPCTGATIQEDFNLSEYSKGVYFIRIQTSNNTIMKKVIIQ